MSRIATKLAPRHAGTYRYPHHVHYPCRAITGSNAPQNKRTNPKCQTPAEVTMEEGTTSSWNKQSTNPKHRTSYYKVSMLEAENRLGIKIVEFEMRGIPVSQMLAQAKPKTQGLRNDQVQKTKEKVFENIVQYIEGEGFPTEFDEDFNEANVNDLVLLIILPILTAFRRETGRDLLLLREKEMIAIGSKMPGFREVVRRDFIKIGDKKFVLFVEARKSTAGQAKKECLLALKDMGDNNGEGMVYGFLTSGGQWQMIRYDGVGFTQTDRFQVLFCSMEHEKERWMKEYSVIVDCVHMALRGGELVAM